MDLFTLVGSISIDITNAMSNIESVIGKVNELETLLNGTQTTTQNTVQETGEAVTKTAEGATKSISSTLSQWNIMLGNIATQVAYKAYDFGKSFFQTGYEYNTFVERQIANFKTLLQTTEEDAASFFGEIEKFAIETPLSLEGAVETATKLLGVDVERSDLIETMQMLGDVALGDTTRMERLAKALTDVQANTTFLAQEGRQTTEVGVPIWRLLSEYYAATDGTYSGWSAADLKASDKKKFPITYEDYLGALQMSVAEGGMFYGAMQTAMETTEGQAERMLDDYRRTAGAVTKSIVDVFSSETIPAINEILKQLNEWATENPDALKKLAEAFSDFATTGLKGLLDGLTGLVDFWNNNKGVFQLMTAALGGLLMATGHPAAGVALLIASEANGTEGLEETYKNEDGSYRTNILFPGLSEQMNDSLPNEDKEAGRYSYFSENARAVAESLWDMQRLGITGAEVSGFESLMAQVYEEFGKISTDLGVTDTEYGVTALLTDLIQQMMTLDKTKEDLPDDWFYDPNDIEPPTDWTLRRHVDPGEIVGKSGENVSVLSAVIQSAMPQMRAEVSAGAQEGVAAGLSGVTITGTITTGNVTLNTGALVGQLMPRLDIALGNKLNRASRG